MRKEALARILTCALMAAIVLFLGYRRRTTEQSTVVQEAPESAVWKMLDAWKSSDPEKYLDCYTGEMQVTLRRNLLEMGAEGFRRYLSETHSQLKGAAVSSSPPGSAGENRIHVEYV